MAVVNLKINSCMISEACEQFVDTKGSKMEDIKLPYKPNFLMLLFVIVFFSSCALILANVALNNDRGLVLNRIFEFSTQGAALFYWCLTGAAGIFVILGVIGVIFGLTSKNEIILTENKITAPKSGISKKLISINYSDIKDLSVQSVHKQKFLNIFHQGGKLTIPQSMLPNKQAFEELIALLSAKVNK